MRLCNLKSLVFLSVVAFLFVVCTIQPTLSSEASKQEITYDVPQSAEIASVSYFVQEYKGKKRLHMKVGIKNISDKNLRYRVNIYLPDGVAGGGMYPRKADAIKAGEVHNRTFPMYYNELPTRFDIVVKELES
jgi:uncharacterized protein YcfL